MSKEDMFINQKVRAVICQNWVDDRYIQYGSTNGTIYIKGRLRKTRGSCDFSAGELIKLERQLARIKDVQRVTFNVENWKREVGGKWSQGK